MAATTADAPSPAGHSADMDMDKTRPIGESWSPPLDGRAEAVTQDPSYGLGDEAGSTPSGRGPPGHLAPMASRASSVWISDTLSRPREAAMVAIICSTQICALMGLMGPIFISREIGAGLGVDAPAQLAWIVSGYSLTVGTFILVSGRLGDQFGYKNVLLVGYAWYAVWSVVVGLSVFHRGGGGWVLAVFARVLQGIGPALCLPNALAILGAAYPPGHRKAMVFSFFGAVAPYGGVFGAAMASVLALAWWPWAFWGFAIFFVALGVAGYLIIPDMPMHRARGPASRARSTRPPSLLSRLGALSTELDIPGAAVGVAALVLFNVGWNMAPIHGWGRPEAIAPLILGLALFAVFIFVELHVAERPLVPLDALNVETGFVLTATLCGWATFGIWALYTVQILEDIRGLSPLLTSAWFSPVIVAGTIAAVTSGKLLGRWGVTPPVVMTMAAMGFFVGIILIGTTPVYQIYWGQTFVSMVVIPFGMDMSFPAATLILSNAVAKEHQGIAASLVSTIVNYGTSLGVGFAGTVEYYVNDGGVTKEQKLRGYKGGFYTGIGLSGLGLAVCLVFLARDRIHGRQGTRAREVADGGETASLEMRNDETGEKTLV